MVRRFAQAVGLLTRIPVPAALLDPPAGEPGRLVGLFPLVGLLIGALLAAVALALPGGGSATLSALLVVALWAVLTGALHLDGWADCCDALFVPVGRERRLEILKDPHLGSFGVVGLVLLVLLKAAACQVLLAAAAADPLVGTPARLRAVAVPFLLAPVLARWAIAIAAWLFPLAKPGGMAAFFRQGLAPADLALATATALTVATGAGLTGAAALALAWLVALAWGRFATGRLGGVTGDVYGALVELTETAILVLLAWTGSA